LTNQSINQSRHISIAPYVASESEAHGRELIRYTSLEQIKLANKLLQAQINSDRI